MYVALAEDDVVLTANLDLVSILGAEQNLIAAFHRSDVWSDGHDFGPHQALADLGRCRDQDASSGPTLALWPAQMDKHTVVQHLNGEFLAVGTHAFGQSIGSWRCGHDTTVPSSSVAHDFTPRSLRLTTTDGLSLEAELVVPDHPRAAVVLCHPHPQQGGNMSSLVTSELFRTLPAAGLAVLRFNFRGVGTSEGEHEFGVGEKNDIVAALDCMEIECPGLDLVLSGWSFGADTSLAVLDPRITAWVACAPPLRVLPLEDLTGAAGSDPRPKLLIVPEHDQFCDPEAARQSTEAWIATEVVAVPGADHFFVGRTDKVAAMIVAFVEHQLAD